MKRRCGSAWRRCAVVTLLLVAPAAAAQDQGKPPPRPPDIDRLLALAKDPEKIRQLMLDPVQLQDVMRMMESPAVQDYFRDPQRIQELMREVDMNQIGQAMRAIDPTVVRRAMTVRMMERLRNQLGASEEEWKVLGPMIEKLMAAQQEVRAGIRGLGRGGQGGGPGGGFFGGGAGEPSEVEEAAAAVREAASDPDIDRRETAIRLREYRRVRDKARQHLDQVQRDLRELLTARQEGILVMLGFLE